LMICSHETQGRSSMEFSQNKEEESLFRLRQCVPALFFYEEEG